MRGKIFITHLATERAKQAQDAQEMVSTEPDKQEEQQEDLEEEIVLSKKDIREIKRLVRCYEHTLDYLAQRSRPLRWIWINLLGGMAKGFGIALGITVLAFIAIKILDSLQVFDLPIIGNFIAELIEYINSVQGMV